MPELLADHTTFRVGGPARRFVEATTECELVDAVAEADDCGEPLLILSGGSNLLVSDQGFPGTVIHVATAGISVEGSWCEFDADIASPVRLDAPTEGRALGGGAAACGGFLVEVAAGENWDELVAFAVANELVGLECLSGIPGLVGATPIQNVGAYGQDVSQTVWSVRTYDRHARAVKTFANADCAFGYRHSRFKSDPGRYVVLGVTFQLEQGSLSAPLRYAELARRLGVVVGDRAPLAAVRDAVLELRRGKGMVLDAADHDTWSAGSFFTNPIVDAPTLATLPDDAPRFPQPDGRFKSSAAWLIENAGFGKGFGTPPATLSSKHTLALTNRGGASAADLLALARTVRDGVLSRFGVELTAEPVLVGLSLDEERLGSAR